MKRYHFLPLLMAWAFFTACERAEIQPTDLCMPAMSEAHAKADLYQGVIDEYTRKGLPGIAVLIRDEDGEWSGASGMADIHRGVPFQVCHVSKVASVTKLFVGVLVMKLVEDGTFALDDPIRKWLSDKTLKRIANADQVSIRQLLNHTSGIYDLIDDNAFYLAILNHPGRKWKPDELLEYVRGDDAVFPPGTDVEYSNTNFLLTAMIIEAATGQSHATLLRQRILDPLSLSDTYYHWHEGLPGLVAQGYFDLYNNGNLLEMSNFNTGSGNGYGGLYSTIYDMRTFIEALLRDKTLLSPASLEEMLTITSEDLVSGEAYGVTIRKDFLDRSADEFGLGHRGRDLAYSADLFYFPTRDMTISYLVNYGTDAKSELREVFLRFREAMVDAMMKK